MAEGREASFGPYRLLRRIAVGGMAEVWQARYVGPEGPEGLRVGSIVALKRLLPTAAEQGELVRGFEEEARLMLRLDHPLVARAWELARQPPEDSEAGEPYLVLEYVEGRPLQALLRELIRRGEGAPADAVAAVGAQVASALAHVHGLTDADGRPLGVVHRDVSPHNLILTPGGRVKLVDFGIAKQAARPGGTESGVLKGKQAYMSPEQVAGEPLDGRSDLFSLGVSLWELATGRRLFRGATLHETLERVVEADVPGLAEAAPDLPQALAEGIERCLSRAPAGRPANAGEVAQILSAWLADRGERPEAVLSRRYEAWFGAEPAVAGETLGAYRAGLQAAEDLGEETTDRRGVEDATRMFDPEARPSRDPRRPVAVGVTWLVVALVLAFTLATTLWFVDRMGMAP